MDNTERRVRAFLKELAELCAEHGAVITSLKRWDSINSELLMYLESDETEVFCVYACPGGATVKHTETGRVFTEAREPGVTVKKREQPIYGFNGKFF